jgi:hypothetical protein
VKFVAPAHPCGRGISASLHVKAELTRVTAEIGAVTLIQRFGSASKLNIRNSRAAPSKREKLNAESAPAYRLKSPRLKRFLQARARNCHRKPLPRLDAPRWCVADESHGNIRPGKTSAGVGQRRI